MKEPASGFPSVKTLLIAMVVKYRQFIKAIRFIEEFWFTKVKLPSKK